MPFSGILGGTAVTDRTMINDLPVTGVFGHLPSEAFQVSFEHAFCMTTFMRSWYLSFVRDSHDVVTPSGQFANDKGVAGYQGERA